MKETGRLVALDSLRGLAAIGVAFFWHYVHFDMAYASGPRVGLPFYSVFAWFYDHGYSLVDFFFVLSGFVFMRTYAQKILDETISFKEFAVYRLSRLYPLHLLTLLVVAVEVVWMQSKGHAFIYDHNDVLHFVLSLFLLQSAWLDSLQVFNGPSWSIATELIVYLVFFATLTKLKNKSHLNNYRLTPVGSCSLR